MSKEKDYVYEVETEVSMLNENNILKPYAYQTLFSQIAEQHLNKFNVNIDTTMKYNLAWALVSLSIKLVKPVEGCIKMYALTWHSKRQGPFFRREFIFKNEKDEIMFKGSTFSVLLDIKKHTVYRKKELPFILPEPIEDFAVDATPTFKTNLKFSKVDERKVYNSYIDCLGHVNNCRYGEFAYDAFSDEERQNLVKLKRMDINFLSELMNNDAFSILKANDKNKVFIQGYNSTKNKVSFNIRLEFKE